MGERTVTGNTFEYGVILKGSQTSCNCGYLLEMFEYGVILKGSQTLDLS